MEEENLEKQCCPSTAVHGLSDVVMDTPPKIDSPSTGQTGADNESVLPKFVTSPGAFAEFPKSSAVSQLFDSGVRGNGMILLFSLVYGLETDLRELKAELNSLRKSYHDECIKNASLKSELAALKKLKLLQNIFIIMGGLLNTLGIKLWYDQQKPAGIILLILGLVMIFAGLLWPKGTGSTE
jgi:hypothetical protein